MGTEISSPLQLTIEEFEVIQTALLEHKKRCLAYADQCHKSYSGKVSTEMKEREWKEKAEFCDQIESKIAQEFS